MITQDFYKVIADLINDAQARGTPMVTYLNRMRTDLANSEIPSTNIHRQKLDDQITATTSVVADRNQSYTDCALGMVNALQSYVADRYSSVNDFIRDGGIQVKEVFADISGFINYPIDPDLVESTTVISFTTFCKILVILLFIAVTFLSLIHHICIYF